MKLEVLFLNDVTGAERNIESTKKQDAKKKQRGKSNYFGGKLRKIIRL
jgi:hypothetical protein